MKTLHTAIATIVAAMVPTLLAGAAQTDKAAPPDSPRMTADLDYYDYYEVSQPPQVEPSPSDVKVEPEKKTEEEAAPGAPEAGCDVAPCDGGCDQACDGGCDNDSCGCNCYLFGPDEAWELFPKDECSGIKIGGWISAGFHDETTPLSTVRGDGAAFNDVPDAFNAHQVWFYLEKDAQGDNCTWELGYRVDVLYGVDAQKTQAFGNPPDAFGNPRRWDNPWDHGVYGWAIPQAYVELARGDLSIIAGHFYTLVGYEVVPAPDNFFYSHSLTMFNSEPFTHTGVVATYTVNDRLELYGGWTLGWDTGYDQFEDGSSWLGGFKVSLTDCLSLAYISTAGDLGLRGSSGYTHSIVLDVTLTERLNYVLQSDLVGIDADARNGGAANDQVGINQYLIYHYNDCVGVGGRMEWWKSDGDSHYELTGGLNIRPHANLVFRPEVRYDWQPSADLEQTTFGIDAVFTW